MDSSNRKIEIMSVCGDRRTSIPGSRMCAWLPPRHSWTSSPLAADACKIVARVSAGKTGTDASRARQGRYASMPAMKRALITGVTGQDGSSLAEFLLSKG